MRLVGAVVLAALAIVAAGCGGGSNSGETAVDDVTTVEKTTATDTTSTEGGSDAGTTVDEDRLADVLGSEECADLASVSMRFAQALGAGSGDSADLDATQTYLEKLADGAPEEIRDDFAVLAEAWKAIVEVYDEMGLELGQVPTPEQQEKFQDVGEKLAETLDDERFDQAGDEISAWVQENCTAGG